VTAVIEVVLKFRDKRKERDDDGAHAVVPPGTD
jgi:hypothetical protein